MLASAIDMIRARSGEGRALQRLAVRTKLSRTEWEGWLERVVEEAGEEMSGVRRVGREVVKKCLGWW